MDENSLLVMVEPVLPLVNSKAAYAQSQWARDLGYIEDPVKMSGYMQAIESAGLKLEFKQYERSRETGPVSWKRKIVPESFYVFYRQSFRPIYAQTSFNFVCRKK